MAGKSTGAAAAEMIDTWAIRNEGGRAGGGGGVGNEKYI